MRKTKRPNMGIVVIVICFLYFLYILIDQQRIINEKQKEIAQIETQIVIARKKGTRLKKQLASVNSDENIQRVAREKLGYVKDGEKIFVDINR